MKYIKNIKIKIKLQNKRMVATIMGKWGNSSVINNWVWGFNICISRSRWLAGDVRRIGTICFSKKYNVNLNKKKNMLNILSIYD